MIPKIIHYIWVGNNPMPQRNVDLIASNARHLAGYDIRIWREADLDLTPLFVARAYAAKRWAFVSDYLRFVILRDMGGIYLDTDMELFRPLDDLLQVPAFSGFNRDSSSIYCGVIGAEPQQPLMQQLVRDYDALPEGVWPTSPDMMTATVKAHSEFELVVHPFYLFYPVDEGKKADPALLAKAYATHHWDESWRSHVPLRRFLRRIGIIPLYHSALKRFY